MTDTPARLLRLLSLLQTPREWPGSERAERLQVTARTVRRDIDRPRELGYPVQASMGVHGGYRLVAGRPWPSPSACARRRGADLALLATGRHNIDTCELCCFTPKAVM